VLAARVRLLGEEHPDTQAVRDNLAATLAAQGDLEGARRLQDQVPAARARLLRGEEADTSL
jgi:eukaryotic-like serine/threonine-protein kinase